MPTCSKYGGLAPDRRRCPRETDGVHAWCDVCRAINAKTKAELPAVARQLVFVHGYSRPDADVIAGRLFDPYECCAICGCPNHRIMDGRAVWGSGPLRETRRLTCDHIIPKAADGPSTLENTQLLCIGCQLSKRDDTRQMTNVRVLEEARNFYEAFISERDKYWLHTTPGQGGRRFRNAYMQRKHETMTGRVLPMTGPLPTSLAEMIARRALEGTTEGACVRQA